MPTDNQEAKGTIERKGIVLDPIQDGITHINVYSGGNTRVGREMSNMSRHPIDHPRHGNFDTIEGFWWWLSTGMKDDYFRACSGFDARKKGYKMEKVTHTAFKHEIRYAIALKLKTYPEILKRLVNSTLPLTHYYVYGRNTPNPLVRPADRSMWVIDFLLDVRASGGEVIEKVLA